MMHIYICVDCKRAYMISRRKQAVCRTCGGYMVQCPTSFNDWVEETPDQRDKEIEQICVHGH
jgi:rRNA maturation endonuclease Nob1